MCAMCPYFCQKLASNHIIHFNPTFSTLICQRDRDLFQTPRLLLHLTNLTLAGLKLIFHEISKSILRTERCNNYLFDRCWQMEELLHQLFKNLTCKSPIQALVQES